MAAGRPTAYTLELAKEICDAIASQSKGLKQLCDENPHWPDRSNIKKWIRKDLTFRAMYTEAKKDQVESLVDDILEIADDTRNDTLTKYDHDGEPYEVCNSEWINRSRLRVDTRKWLAAKLCPRLYGDNALAQELAREMDEFKKMLELKNGVSKNGREEVDSKGD